MKYFMQVLNKGIMLFRFEYFSEFLSQCPISWKKLIQNLTLLTLILLISCGQDNRKEELTAWMKDNRKLKILSTTAMINDLVKRIALEDAHTITLIQGNLDPHSYQLVKGDDEKLGFADIVFANGLGLEHGASLQHTLEVRNNVVFLGNRLQEAFPSNIIYIEGQIDPHLWMDMSLFAKAVPIIAEEIGKKDPEHRDLYLKRGELLVQELLNYHNQVFDELQRIPSKKRYLMTSHDAFNYFAKAYLAEKDELENDSWKERFQAPEGLAPDSQLSSADIRLMVEYLKNRDIHVIFPESNVSIDSLRKIEQVGKENGLEVVIAKDPLYGDAMGPPGSDGDSYPKMVLHNAKIIKKYLDGK